MKKIRKKIIMVVFFIAIFSPSLFTSCLFAAGESKETGVKPAAVSDNTKSQSQFPGIIVRPKEEFKVEGLRDPFQDYFQETVTPGGGVGTTNEPSIEPEQKLPLLEVQGIIRGGRLNQAIVNNKIVKVGDTIEGVRITNIDKDGITVFFGNKSYNISSPAAGILQSLEKKPEGGEDEK